MRARTLPLLVCGLTLAAAGAPMAQKTALAQQNAGKRPPSRQPMIEQASSPGYTLGSPPAFETGPNYFHASTLQQGVLDGVASVIRAEGLAVYNASLAAEHFVAARREAIRNDLLAADTRYQYRLMVRDYRRQLRPQMSAEQVAQISRSRTPERLSANDVDRWGRIQWPAELAGKQFEADREELERLFVTAAGYEAEQLSYERVQPVVKRMLAELRESQTKMSAERYLAARKFLNGLGYEARISSEDVRLAQRQ